jgi:hypothetical protein
MSLDDIGVQPPSTRELIRERLRKRYSQPEGGTPGPAVEATGELPAFVSPAVQGLDAANALLKGMGTRAPELGEFTGSVVGPTIANAVARARLAARYGRAGAQGRAIHPIVGIGGAIGGAGYGLLTGEAVSEVGQQILPSHFNDGKPLDKVVVDMGNTMLYETAFEGGAVAAGPILRSGKELIALALGVRQGGRDLAETALNEFGIDLALGDVTSFKGLPLFVRRGLGGMPLIHGALARNYYRSATQIGGAATDLFAQMGPITNIAASGVDLSKGVFTKIKWAARGLNKDYQAAKKYAVDTNMRWDMGELRQDTNEIIKYGSMLSESPEYARAALDRMNTKLGGQSRIQADQLALAGGMDQMKNLAQSGHGGASLLYEIATPQRTMVGGKMKRVPIDAQGRRIKGDAPKGGWEKHPKFSGYKNVPTPGKRDQAAVADEMGIEQMNGLADRIIKLQNKYAPDGKEPDAFWFAAMTDLKALLERHGAMHQDATFRGMLKAADDKMLQIMTELSVPAVKRFETVYQDSFSGIGGLFGRRKGVVYPDQSVNLIWNEFSDSPQAMADIRKLFSDSPAGKARFRAAIAAKIDEIWQDSFFRYTDESGELMAPGFIPPPDKSKDTAYGQMKAFFQAKDTPGLINIPKLRREFGFDNKNSGRYQMMKEAFKDMPVNLDKMERFINVSEAALRSMPRDVNNYVARHLALGGIRSLTSLAYASGGKGNPGAIKTAAAVLTFRSFGDIVTSPFLMRSALVAFDDTVKHTRRKAALRGLYTALHGPPSDIEQYYSPEEAQKDQITDQLRRQYSQ